jgi:hypothetical protein
LSQVEEAVEKQLLTREMAEEEQVAYSIKQTLQQLLNLTL